MGCEKERCGACQLSLFAGIDGSGGANEAVATAEPNFDKDKDIGIDHDEIDLAVAAPEITAYRAQAVFDQIPKRNIFGVSAALSPVY